MNGSSMYTDSHLAEQDPSVDISPELTDVLRISVVASVEELSGYAESWNALSYEVPPRIPTSSYAWVSACLEHFVAADETWRCIFAHRGERLVGVLPLIVSRKMRIGLTWLRTPMHGHLIALSPLLFPGEEADTLRALLRAAWASYPGLVWIEVSDLPANSPVLAHLDDHVHLELKRRTGRYVRVDGDQDRYQSSLSKNFRSNQRKAANKLAKLNGVETAFLTGQEASSSQLFEFIPVEASGWKGRSGTAIQQSSALIAFYRTLTSRLASAGWLEWHFLRADGRVLAANLAVHFNRSIVVWKLGFDEGKKHCSPGGMLFQSLLDRAFADPDIDEINLVTNASWYDHWRMEEREYYRIRFYQKRRPLSILLGFVPDCVVYLPLRNRTVRSVVRAGWRWKQRVFRRSSPVYHQDGDP